ncbi:MAG: glycoside hydrolase family 88 protein [Bacteroidales bacterium]|nr:glycoside hydrolase family 88 protein [Bacteroidales bacterium]
MRRVLLVSLILAVSCSGGRVDVKNIVSTAERQCLLMEKSLSDSTMPKTFQGDTLVTSSLSWWCSGFFPGTCWYTYMIGGNEDIRNLALEQTAKLLDVERLCKDHDIGFQVMCSAAQAYKVTGDSLFLPTIRAGAEKLAARFSPVTGVIQSWTWDKYSYPVIIDNMMNLELLTYASELFDVPQWKEIAISHARTTMKNHFRSDYSSYHVVDYNPIDGSVIKKQTAQGYADESSWARGQAWALYGYTMMFRETGLPEFLEQAQNVASYLLPLLKDRPVPAWDFNAPPESIGQDDASAAAIMASAFFELSQLTHGSPASKDYRHQGEEILKALSSENYLCSPGECGGFILKHSTGNYNKGSEVDVPLTYADYYYMEALYRYGR